MRTLTASAGLFTLALFLVGCGGQESPDGHDQPTQEHSSRTFDDYAELRDYGEYQMLAALPSEASDVQMDALFEGRLTTTESGCITAVRDATGDETAIRFPAETTLLMDNTLQLPSGKQLSIGDDISVGGGSRPVDESVPRELIDTCDLHEHQEIFLVNDDE